MHLDRLQALTGLTDEKMKQVSDTAIEMSKNFKASAGEIVDSMTLIGSQAPQLLSDPEALASVTEAANVLAKAAGIEVIDSAKGITTVMNQMKVSASEVSDVINVLAASSQQGSADVAYLNTAFEKAGTAASSAGMNYTQLAAVIEAVAPKFSSADVAGHQLASTLLRLSLRASDEFNPAMVGMKTALENMAAAQLNDKQIKDMVGESNVTMLKTLIQQKDVYSQLEQSLANTNTAYDQAAIVSDNLQGKIGKLTSTWDAFLIKLGQSQYMQNVIDGIIAVLGLAGEVVNQIDECIEALDELGIGGENINLLKIQMEVFTVVVKVLGGVLKGLITVFGKLFNLLGDTGSGVIDWISDKWNEFMKQLNNTEFGREIVKAFKWIQEKVGEYLDTCWLN